MLYNGLKLSDVVKNRQKFGANVLPDVSKKTFWDFFSEIYHDKINMILLVMLGLLFFVAAIGYGSWAEPMGVAFVLVIVFWVGIITKMRAQKYTTELLNKSAVRYCNVIRDRKIQHINVKDVVVGDVVVLQSGETIPADGYVVYGEIFVNNAILNGESEDCLKQAVANYKYDYKKVMNASDYVSKNLLFSGTTVQSGDAKMIVTRVGIHTENAKTLMAMRSVQETKTDLDIKLEKFASTVTTIGYVGAILFFVLMMISGIYQVGGWQKFLELGTLQIVHNVILQITIALTIVVSVVPEGLPLVISIITAQNARKMLKHNILAKNTHKISESGNIQILCTDKTGTLTYGKLIPITNYLGNGTQIGFDSQSVLGEMITACIVLNTEAMFDSKNNVVGGTVTQRALLGTVDINSKIYKKVIKQNSVANKMAFNSANKYSFANVKSEFFDKKVIALYTGAPELILAHATRYMDVDGVKHKLNKAKMRELLSYNAKQAKRLVALAYHECKNTDGKIQNDLILLSLVAIRDDVRAEVPAAVKRMNNAGIQVVMITGDIIDTANAIAVDAGIVKNKDDIVISAPELESMSDNKIIKILPKIRVIARATPSTKLRLVQVAQKLNLCIGMCGDGTNDAPALRQADVGFAMGSGTDVCKEAGDIIITDDNFVSVTDTVLFGRTFIENVNKFLAFQLPVNIVMMIACLIYPMFFGVMALTAVQILIINIVTDSLNSLAFGGEPTKSEYMHVPPLVKGAPLINRDMLYKAILDISIFLFVMLILTLPWFQNEFGFIGDKNLSARFAVLTFISVINGFNIREKGFNLLHGITKNPLFISVAVIILSFTFIVINYGEKLFGMQPLDTKQWLVICLLSLIIIPMDLIRKKLLKK
ncbi:MAG: cation-translocating P-type ATPase [Alphaproteobacteria bacterium]